jgi:hypothetical protein
VTVADAPAEQAEPKPPGQTRGDDPSVSTAEEQAAPGEAAPVTAEDVDEPAASSTGGSKKDEITGMADILAYCRKVDG